ncbi:MAG: type II toxin-antitoxin system prevent-host-death family antitoxin [Saprospiraceae bacterium]
MNTSVSITDLRANLKDALAKVSKGLTIHITQRGKTIAELGPPHRNKIKSMQQELEKIRVHSKIHGDIVSPIFDGDISMDGENVYQ